MRKLVSSSTTLFHKFIRCTILYKVANFIYWLDRWDCLPTIFPSRVFVSFWNGLLHCTKLSLISAAELHDNVVSSGQGTSCIFRRNNLLFNFYIEYRYVPSLVSW